MRRRQQREAQRRTNIDRLRVLPPEWIMESTMPRAAELREQSREYRQMAREESAPVIKRYLVSHAVALADLAERIEHTAEEKSEA